MLLNTNLQHFFDIAKYYAKSSVSGVIFMREGGKRPAERLFIKDFAAQGLPVLGEGKRVDEDYFLRHFIG